MCEKKAIQTGVFGRDPGAMLASKIGLGGLGWAQKSGLEGLLWGSGGHLGRACQLSRYPFLLFGLSWGQVGPSGSKLGRVDGKSEQVGINTVHARVETKLEPTCAKLVLGPREDQVFPQLSSA